MRYNRRGLAYPREKGMKPLAFALALIALFPGVALATQMGVQAAKNWKSMDLCAKQAQTAYPDFTPDANAKREAKLAECLQNQSLPPRVPLSPQR